MASPTQSRGIGRPGKPDPVLIEPVHIFVPKGRIPLRVSSRGCSQGTYLIRYWGKLAPTKTAKIWSTPTVEQRPRLGETLSDRFVLEDIDSYFLAILVFQYSGEHWSRAPQLGNAKETIPVQGIAFGPSRVAPESEFQGPAILIDVDYDS